jgi:hypothetical protein
LVKFRGSKIFKDDFRRPYSEKKIRMISWSRDKPKSRVEQVKIRRI